MHLFLISTVQIWYIYISRHSWIFTCTAWRYLNTEIQNNEHARYEGHIQSLLTLYEMLFFFLLLLLLSLNLGTIMVSCNTRWIMNTWYSWCTSQNTDKVIPSSETNSDYCIRYSVLHWMVYYKLYWSQQTEINWTLNTSTWTYHQDNIYQILNMVLDFISIQNHWCVPVLYIILSSHWE